jgi:RimJ/RimL family protein N-acetyltransferase
MSHSISNQHSILQPALVLVEYDARCLDLSWTWLNDPEIGALTMTPPFTREQQAEFFASLDRRRDYLIWGIEADGHELIGAAGLKNHRGTRAEYWGYIGERKYWGKGYGHRLVAAVENKARAHGFSQLDLRVARTNSRAIALYEKAGFVADPQASTDDYVLMLKRGI